MKRGYEWVGEKRRGSKGSVSRSRSGEWQVLWGKWMKVRSKGILCCPNLFCSWICIIRTQLAREYCAIWIHRIWFHVLGKCEMGGGHKNSDNKGFSQNLLVSIAKDSCGFVTLFLKTLEENHALKPVLWSLRRCPVTDLLSPEKVLSRTAVMPTWGASWL